MQFSEVSFKKEGASVRHVCKGCSLWDMALSMNKYLA